ncbi:cutinase family protein [Nocardia noduli]|uniref:cutinase family protein n=1 Tax=Nocardia noduli TaxID=2815722 RepID=UPI001C2247B0|nr:cutinase family protein [Nocardia noduli]
MRIIQPRHRPTTTVAVAVAVAILTTLTGAGIATAEPTENCPSLHALGVQGGEEGTTDATVTSDSGALGKLFGSMTAAAGNLVQRTYIPFGTAVDGASPTFHTAIDDAARRLEASAVEVVTRCPNTRIAVAGYAHGAASVSEFAARVGAGSAGIRADQVAAVALLANPERRPDSPVLPGRADSVTPSPAPGTTGSQVAKIQLLNPALTGAGITASSAAATGYGALIGRVADLCVAADATCNTTPGGTLATAVTDLASRTDLRDPIAAISTLADALSTTVFRTAVDVVNEDLSGTSLDQLSYQPATALAVRISQASQADTVPPTADEALSALFKIGTIGLNAAITVARTVITPATVAELAAVGMADPLAAVAILGTKLAAAVVELVPPQTANRWVNEAFTAITTAVTEPSELYTLAGTARYSDTAGRHNSYQTVPATPSGESALDAAAHWFAAAARDLSATPSSPAPSRTATPQPSMTDTPPASSIPSTPGR